MTRLEARLAELAKRSETITYGALAQELGWRIAELTAALETLMEEDARSERPLRAALCEGRLSGGMPARGFFDKAAALGFDLSDPSGFVAQQRQALSLG